MQVYPMAVVATAERGLIVYQLENQPSEFRRIDSPLKHQVINIPLYTLCLSPDLILNIKQNSKKNIRVFRFLPCRTARLMYFSVPVLQHRCVAIFKDKQNKPTGFALGSIEGRVAIHYINPPNP